MILVTELGDVLGTWCITEVEETQARHTADGRPRRVGFRLVLEAYGEDEEEEAAS